MGLLAPIALAAVPLLAIILALYLLKLRRPMAPVASLHLWGSLTRDREANTLWQRLRVSALLLLQLLALLVLILALARPWTASSERIGQHAIIVIDVSASMGATDGDERGTRTRLQAAQDRASGLIDSLPQDGTATLISSDMHAAVVVPATGDRARLRDAISRLRVQATGTDMVEASKLSTALAARQSNSVVWILSDGAFPSVKDQVPSIHAELRHVTFGWRSANIGITALSLQQRAGSLQLFVQILNANEITVTKRLDLTIDDVPWTGRTVTLGPGGTQELVLEDVPIGARVVQAHVAGGDDLDLDDTAWVVNRASAPGNVLLVSAGNKFLELALSLLPTVTLYKVDPKDYQPAQKINGAQVDLTLFDGGVPAPVLSSTLSSTASSTAESPLGNLLVFAPEASSPLVEVTGVLTDPIPTLATVDERSQEDAGARDPLLRYVDLSALHIAKASRLEIPAWARVALSSDKGPLILAGERAGSKVAVVAFDIRDSDLPLQTAFPILSRNLVTYLLPDPTGGLPAGVSPGEPVGIAALAPAVDKVLVEDPSAKEWTYPVPNDSRRVAFAETSRPGVYYVSQYSGDKLVGQEAFAVNLFSRDESRTGPNSLPGLPVAEPPAAGEPVASATSTAELTPSGPLFRRELWPFVAVAGFTLLLIEWAYAHRIAIRRAVTERQTRRALKEL
jgi:Ca-activated chloride channel homolog